MTQFSFNLVTQPWIPCLQNGQITELGLQDLFEQAHRLEGIAGTFPMQTAALYRLLLAILHRNFHTPNPQAYRPLWQSTTFDMDTLNPYLENCKERFDLFHPQHPFYQHDDNRFKPRSILGLKYASGFEYNPLFDHDNEKTGLFFTPAQAARLLVTTQQFGFGGLSGLTGKSHTDAPCAKGVIFLVQGNTLRETLLLNMIRYPANKPIPQSDIFLEYDLPAWEQNDPFALEIERNGYPFGYLDYLTWQSRRILLYPEQNHDAQTIIRQWKIGLGLRLHENIAYKDSMKHYFFNQKSGYTICQFREDRQLWRDSYAFFAVHAEREDNTNQPPYAFDQLHILAQDHYQIVSPHARYRCLALGIAKDQGKALFYRQEQFPLPLKYLQDQNLFNQLKDILERTEKIARTLTKALAIAGLYLFHRQPPEVRWDKYHWNSKLPPQKKLSEAAQIQIENWLTHANAETQFWAFLDTYASQLFWELANPEQHSPPAEEWKQQVRQIANQAFNKAFDFTNPTATTYQAFTYGKKHLTQQLNRIFPQAKKETHQ